ncbi:MULTISPECIES: AraC family transcriptional regulator [Rhodomicrobium]|uniref:helix-turn-helix domain-containing protein n=1 Tax=Rhodomicrobium TaxID=1068 RepID=UPI000B4AFE5C|nr:MULTISPECIES: AraC family transcriptional regulator [Rhodomicrobium]
MLPSPKIYRPSPALAGIVDCIVDLDFPDGEAAKALTIKVLPTTAPALVLLYRPDTQADCRWRFGPKGFAHKGDMHAAAKLETGIVTIYPTGPIGALIVCLKPEAAACVMGAPVEDFMDRRIALGQVFGDGEVSLLEEMLAESGDRAGRLACVERFLLARTRRPASDPIVSRAVGLLRRAPSFPVQRLASTLDISEKQFRRRFHAAIGSNPKQFARIARIGRSLVERRRGANWAQVAHACGYQDQAHLIHDFNQIVGRPPDAFLGTAAILPGMEWFSFAARAPGSTGGRYDRCGPGAYASSNHEAG